MMMMRWIPCYKQRIKTTGRDSTHERLYEGTLSQISDQEEKEEEMRKEIKELEDRLQDKTKERILQQKQVTQLQQTVDERQRDLRELGAACEEQKKGTNDLEAAAT